jgi:drug/metabolite transporter (DMT)-like permease
MVVLAAIGSALLYALASVLQQHAAEQAPREHSLRLRLLVYLFQRPLFLLGVACDVGAYGLQWLALRHGSLSLVQPLLLTGLLFALPLGARLAGRSPTTAETLAAVAVVVGLSMALAAANPTAGDAVLDDESAVTLALCSTAVITALLVLARGRVPTVRAALLALVAGVMNALLAVLTRSVSTLIGAGIPHLLHQWEPYALAGTAVLSMLFVQSAFQAGPLRASLSALTLSEPIASVLIGQLGLHERIHLAPRRSAVELIGLAAAVTGVLALSRSRAVGLAIAGRDEGPAEHQQRAGSAAVTPEQSR